MLQSHKNLIPLPDGFECICSFVDPTFTKLGSITILILEFKDLDFNPLAYILHKVVKVVEDAVLDLKPPRGPPAELKNGMGWVGKLVEEDPG